ncbi:MAG: hypothetical protein ACOCVF_03215 [bacterium]
MKTINKEFDLALISEKKPIKDSKFIMEITPCNLISLNNIIGNSYLSTKDEIEYKILASLQHMYRIHITNDSDLKHIKKIVKFKDSYRKNKNKFIPIFWSNIDVLLINGNVLDEATSVIDAQSFYTSRMDSGLSNLKTARATDEILQIMEEHNTDDDKWGDIAISKYGDHPELKKYKNHVASFYTKVVNREYLLLKKPLIVECITTKNIYNYLKNTPYNNDCYLGTSECLVNINLKF